MPEAWLQNEPIHLLENRGGCRYLANPGKGKAEQRLGARADFPKDQEDRDGNDAAPEIFSGDESGGLERPLAQTGHGQRSFSPAAKAFVASSCTAAAVSSMNSRNRLVVNTL